MTGVPDYLKEYAENISVKKQIVQFSLKCSCGCDLFRLIQNKYTYEENKQIEEAERLNDKKTGWHTIHGGLDKDGKPYHYIKILCIFKKYFEWEPLPVCANIKEVKAICSDCGKELLIFDNRIHGNDSDLTKKEELEYIPCFDRSTKKSDSKVLIEIEKNDESDDSNCFLFIAIYEVRNGKNKKFFEMETG